MKAVKELSDTISSPQADPPAVLVSFLLLFWADILQSNLVSAFKHLDCGLKILEGIKSSAQRATSPDFEGILQRSFKRLVVQTTMYDRGRACGPFCPLPEANGQIPRHFVDVFESRKY